jgi:hypothetical protein
MTQQQSVASTTHTGNAPKQSNGWRIHGGNGVIDLVLIVKKVTSKSSAILERVVDGNNILWTTTPAAAIKVHKIRYQSR